MKQYTDIPDAAQQTAHHYCCISQESAMKTQAKFFIVIAPLATALLFNVGIARADGPAGAFEEEAPATLSFGTDDNDPDAPQVAATATFIDGNTQQTVADKVAAGFDERGYDPNGDLATRTMFAKANHDKAQVAAK